MRALPLLTAALTLGLVAAACGPLSLPTSSPSRSKIAVVGVVLSLSGAAAPVGTSQANGVGLAVDEINASQALGSGARLEVLVRDDGSDRAQALELFERFIQQDHVVAIVGPSQGRAAHLTDPIAQQAGVPVLAISSTAGLSELGEFVFRGALTEAAVLDQTLQAVGERAGVRRAAVLYLSGEGMDRRAYDMIAGIFQAREIEEVAVETFSRGDQDFSAQLEAIKAAAPDTLVVSAPPAVAPAIVSQARSLGLTGTLIVGGSGFNTPQFVERAGPAAEGVVGGASWSLLSQQPRSQEFVRRYRAAYGRDPDQFAAHAYTGIHVLAEGLRQGKSLKHRRALRAGLLQVQQLDTALGPFSFTPDGSPQYPAIVQVVRGGAFALYR